MARQTRSPLHGVNRGVVAALRAYVVAQLHWERALGTPEQYLEPDAPFWARELLSWQTVERIRQRSLRRWVRMPHHDRSRAVHSDQHMKRYDRKAWEAKQLRLEVEGLRADVAKLQGAG